MDGENCQEASAVPEVQEPNVGYVQTKGEWYTKVRKALKRRRCLACGRWFKPNSGSQLRCETHYKIRKRLGPNNSSRPHVERLIKCRRCGLETKVYRNNQLFCSKRCFRANQRAKSYAAAETETYKVSTTTAGAAAELLVCADLARRGVHTFRAVSPACPYDLVACGTGKTWRLQVKKARRMPPTLEGKQRVQYELSGYKMPEGTDVIALAILQTPMEVFYFQPTKSSVYYNEMNWKFWEEN